MDRREREIRHARRLLGDDRIIAFLRSALGSAADQIHAVRFACDRLQAGEDLDQLFFPRRREEDPILESLFRSELGSGYHLTTKHRSGTAFEVKFGCHAGADMGDGGTWEVTFEGTEVRSIELKEWWIS